MSLSRNGLAFLLFAGCRGPAEPAPQVPAETGATSPSDTGDPTPTGSTGHTGDTGPAEVDCEAVPATPVSMRVIPGARGYHGLVFDDLGHVIGSDGASLIRADYTGSWSVLVPGTGRVEGLGRLSDGDFVGAGDDALFRFTADGGTSPIAGISSIYGVTVGHDDSVWVAGESPGLIRVDPVTGNRTSIPLGNTSAKALHFSRDWTRLYLGSDHGGNGDVHVLDTDPTTLEPAGPPSVFANVGGTPHDCIAVDACDNVYVCDFDTQSMYRVTPEGEVSLYVDLGPTEYAHGAEWGSGVGGWRVDALYVSRPFDDDSVAEIVVGIPGGSYR